MVRDADTIWSRGYGWANIAHELRATKDVEFMLASVSKTVTGVAVMQAVEDGLIDLDADVDELLPFLVRNPEFPDEPITTRMLLTHTSTISDNWGVLTDVYVDGDSPVSLGDFLGGYLTPGCGSYDAERNFLSGHPGTRYRYCNVAVSLAAYLVEAAAGTAFDAWCDERIFAPLAMDETSWHLVGLERRGIAMPYRYVVTQDRYRAYGQYGYPDYPDGQLRSSAAGLARFLLAFIRLGELDGARILQEETVREMRRSQVPDLIAGQGLIWYVLHRRGERLWGHNGGDSGVATQMFLPPERRDGRHHAGERRLATRRRAVAAVVDHGSPVPRGRPSRLGRDRDVARRRSPGDPRSLAVVVGARGLEPLTSSVSGKRSTGLS